MHELKLELIEQKELLEGLLQLTNNSLAFSSEQLNKVIKKTKWKVQTTHRSANWPRAEAGCRSSENG